MSSTIVVTGVSRGIGRAIAEQIVDRGLPLVGVLRSPKQADELRAAWESRAKAPFTFVEADLATRAGQEKAAAGIQIAAPDVGAMIHNAGLWPSERRVDEQGVEASFALNHLAPFALNARLWDLFAANHTRIVHVSAALYVYGRHDLDDVVTGRRFSRYKTYCDTKLANARYTAALAPKAAANGITVNAVHPGVFATELGIGGDWMAGLVRLSKRFFRPPSEGANAPVHAALSPEVAGINGAYFNELRQEPWKNRVGDKALAKALWERSEMLTGVNFPMAPT